MSPWITLISPGLSAQIDPLGAQLSVLRDAEGRDLLWSGDPQVWTGRAPLLFPIVGALAGGSYRWGADRYALPRHGFARGKLFEVLDSSATAASFRLTPDAATAAVYPFRFQLDVRYALNAGALSVTAIIRNPGDENLLASFGFHPAFRWPLPYGQARASHFIEFATDEPAPVRRLNAEGLLLPDGFPTPVSGRRLALTDALFQDDVIIFDALRSRSVTYGAPRGPRIRMDFPDTPFFGVWTKPSADFICLEPWHGVADGRGFRGDFSAKPGVFTVAPGAAFRIGMNITVLA